MRCRMLLRSTVLIIVLCGSEAAWPQMTLEQQEKVLQLIRDTARDICYEIEQRGNQDEINVKGQIQAKLPNVVSKIADLGVGGSGEIRRSEYQGLVRDQVAAAIQKSVDCRRAVFDTLHDSLIKRPVSSDSSRASANTPAPGLRSIVVTERDGEIRFKDGEFTSMADCLLRSAPLDAECISSPPTVWCFSGPESGGREWWCFTESKHCELDRLISMSGETGNWTRCSEVPFADAQRLVRR